MFFDNFGQATHITDYAYNFGEFCNMGITPTLEGLAGKKLYNLSNLRESR